MPRFTCIFRWAPEKTLDVLKRFAEFVKGVKPEVTEAFKRLNYITWEFPSPVGCIVVRQLKGNRSDHWRQWIGQINPVEYHIGTHASGSG